MEVSDEMRERIDEIVETLLMRLDQSGVPDVVCDRLRGPLCDRLADEGFRDFLVAHIHESPAQTLDHLVLAYDPRLELAELSYKN